MSSEYINLSGVWNYPNTIKAGAGSIDLLPEHCKSLGMKAPLLITDPGLAALPMVKDCVESCRSAGLDC